MAKSNFDKFITSKSNSAKKENFRSEKRSVKKDIAEGMAKTKAHKAAETAARKNTAPTGKGAQKGAGKRGDAPENYATRGIPAPEAPLIPRKVSPAKAGEPGVQMPLNKYLAHGGVTSRRDAAIMVKDGLVRVNNTVIKDPGYKVRENDVISVNDKKVVPSKNLVYILLNKPKDVITTSNDPEGRKTVLDLVGKATTERIFPVGRLDRNTTGVLLLTNDGELSQKLAHPAFQVKKIYEIHLDRDLTKKDFDTILAGVELEDGIVTPDALAYADSKDKSVIGIEIHSGKNRIVRRIFEHLEYQVKTLDRVLYAGLSKKNVDRGRWRFLNEKEVRLLKYLNTSFTKKKAEIKETFTDPDAPYVDVQDFDIRPKGAPNKPGKPGKPNKPKRAKAGSSRTKTGTPRSRAHQAGTHRADAPKRAPKADTHRADAPKHAPKADTRKADAPKHTPKGGAPKAGSPKPGAAKTPKPRPSHKKNAPHTNKKDKH